ncbi:MAG: hypothetical protein Q9M22_01725 [Mariprofundaceae bacterium]|nr:hypothetical protein [Mariprofundaceae bacterium]
MEDIPQLMWGVLFGGIGMGYFIYGKKQKKVVALSAGIALCVFPYFITNIYLFVIVGAALLALPYFIRG